MAKPIKFSGGSTAFNFGHNVKPKGGSKSSSRGGRKGGGSRGGKGGGS